jgi:hypothetical protein
MLQVFHTFVNNVTRRSLLIICAKQLFTDTRSCIVNIESHKELYCGGHVYVTMLWLIHRQQ